MHYDEKRVLTAWKIFINQGIILEDHVRPVIARSWQRCMENHLDPWSVDYPKPMPEKLKRVIAENSRLLSFMGPVLEYLLFICNSNISFCDDSGFVFELLSPMDMYSRTYGTRLTEAQVGTGNLPLALIEKRPVRVDRFEQYRAVAQDYVGVSAPVMRSEDELTGVLNINNPYGFLPDFALDLCAEAARIIDNFSRNLDTCMELISSVNIFRGLINYMENPVIVADQAGVCLFMNTAADERFPVEKKLLCAGHSLAESLYDRNELTKLLSLSENIEKERVLFRGKQSRSQQEAWLLRRRMIELPNGRIHNVFLFEGSPLPHAAAGADNIPAELNRSGAKTEDYIGKSDSWKLVDTTVHRISKYKSNVLLLGATGTGKDVVARAIHRSSGRKGNFVAVNCGAIPKELLESALFGYVGGAFTGAKTAGTMGKFEYADGGTLFLDEIGEMNLDMQVSLLRVLQDQTIIKVGSNKPKDIDVRIIAATNRDIHEQIAQGLFRADLYYRLSVIEIHLPLLKDRGGDVVLLAEHFKNELVGSLQIESAPLTAEAIEMFESYAWPGNVRELKNIMEKLLIMTDGAPIRRKDFPQYIQNTIPKSLPVQSDRPEEDRAGEDPETMQSTDIPLTGGKTLSKEDKRKGEKALITRILKEHGCNISKTAEELHMSRSTLYRKIKYYNIEIRISVDAGEYD